MNKITLSFIILFLLCSNQNYGQRVCASIFNPEEVQLTDNPRYQRYLQLEQHILNYKNSLNGGIPQGRLINPNTSTIIIPIVVHVIHAAGETIGVGRNISIAQVQSQVDVLNEDFRRLNADRINTPNAFLGVASDPNFEFRLACIDPNGNPTNGITRTPSSVTAFTANDNIKFNSTGGHDAWLTNQYLNIWVGNLAGGLLGYAQFPFDYTTKPNTDGIVVRTTALGRVGNVLAPFNTGRTATHEVGHWLNLFHIWGDDGNSCNGSDQCNDTPNQEDENIGCPPFPSPSCSNNGDMSMNYMDYSNDACMNLYTLDQSIRMRAIFAQGGQRAAFIDNYFRVNELKTAICNQSTGTVSATNISCLPITWSVVSGPATIVGGQNTNVVTLQGNGNGTALVRATAGGYIDEKNIPLGTPNVNFTLQPFYQGQQFCTNSFGNTISIEPQNLANVTEFQWGYSSAQNGIPPTVVQNNGTYYQDFIFSVGGNYQIFANPSNACGIGQSIQTLNIYVSDNCSGGGFNSFSVSPNPTSGDLQVSATDKITNIKEIKITDKTGNVKKLFTYANNINSVRIDISSLPKDVYYIQIFDGKKWTSKTISKQ